MFPLLPLWGLSSLLQGKREQQLQYATKLRSKYTHISNGLIRTEDIVAQLYQNAVLTAKERDDIQQQLLTPIRASEQLLNTLMSKDTRAYDCFLTALSNTDQNHIAEILKRDDKYLDTEHSLTIQRNYTTLIENLDVESGLLLDRLHEAGLITVREMATITAKLTKHEKSETLLALVSRFSSENFSKFVQTLEKSSQEHVVYILVDKECPKLESIPFTSTVVEARYEREYSESQEKPQRNLELQDNSTYNLQESILHATKRIKTQSSHVKRKSFLTLGSKFANLPDELQTEISLKVAALRQMTVLPSQANVEICFRKLLKGFIQQKKEVNREQTAFEGMHLMLRRINESAESFTHQSEDKYKAEIRTLNEELGWHRNNKRNLDETLNATVIKFDNERQKFLGLERQLQQYYRDKQDLETEKNELRKLVGESNEIIDDYIKKRDKYQKDTEELQKQKDKLQETVNESKQQICDLTEHHQQKIEALEKERAVLQKSTEESKHYLDELHNKLDHSQRESNDLREDRDKLRKLQSESEQRSSDLVKQLKEYQLEIEALQKQKDELPKQLDEEKKLMEASRKTSKALLMNKDCKILELKHKLEQDAKAWAEKEEHLMNRTQELQRELSDILRYKSDPVFVQTIRTKAAEEGTKEIRGLTILHKELYVATEKSSEVEVYDAIKLNFSRRWNLKELIDPVDIRSCNRKKCLYISDHKGDGQSKEILRIDPNGKLIKNWSTGDDYGRLSVTEESNVILAVCEKNKLNEYSPDGQLLREINLSSDEGIRYPWHAIKLSNGHFVVSHGFSDLHRVCIVGDDGKLKKSFGGKPGSAIGQMNYPVYLFVDRNGFVMVVDELNHQIFLLNRDLEFKRVILSKDGKHGLRHPTRILLDESNGRLFVADNDPNNQRISIFDLNN